MTDFEDDEEAGTEPADGRPSRRLAVVRDEDERGKEPGTALAIPGEEPRKAAAPPPAEVIPVLLPGERKPVIPPQWQKGNRWATVKHHAGATWYRSKYHSWRLFLAYIPALFLWGLAGLFRGAVALAEWGWNSDGAALAREAAAAGDSREYMRLHKLNQETRKSRGTILLVIGTALAAGGFVLWHLGPHWIWWLIGAVTLLTLSKAGRPEGHKIVAPAIVPSEYEIPTPEVITRGLGSLGISKIDQAIKSGSGIQFVSDVMRDGPGWGVQLDLPHGVTPAMIMAKRPELASGLRRPLSATYPEAVPGEHEGRMSLWIGFHDMAKMPQPKWPLLKGGTTDLFAGVPFGYDARQRRVDAPLFEANWLIGSSPGDGKTSAVRVLGLAAALDTRAQIWTHEHSGKGDLSPLGQVSHRYVSGLHDDAIAYSADSAQRLRAEVQRRSVVFGKLPEHDKPHGKITPELVARGFRFIVAIYDECFPAGTVVGDIPINELKPGDPVPSWDEATGRPCTGKVTATFRKRPHSLVRVWFAGGSSVTCTPNHPLMTAAGWDCAGLLAPGNEVLSYAAASTIPADGSVHALRDGVHLAHGATRLLAQGPARVLLSGVRQGEPAGGTAEASPDDGGRPGVALAAHARQQSDGGHGGSRAGDGRAPGDRPFPEGARRERPRPHGTAEAPRGGAWLADRGHRADGEGCQGGRPADAFQDRYSEPGPDDRSRGRRAVPLLAGAPSPGPAQGVLAHWQRVDRVEVLEPGSDGRYGGLCPDGHVYNIEVAGTHTYRVGNGIVAHNCHNLFKNKEYGEQAAEDLEYVERLGRAYGIILLFATQRPAKDSLPTEISGIATLRFCLHVDDWFANDAILGTGAYRAGRDATLFRHKTDAGLGWLKGESESQIVRTYYIDLDQAKKVAARARLLREKAGVITGYAAGLDDDEIASPRDVLSDVLDVFGSDKGLQWGELADRLADRFPGRWADLTGEAISTQCRNLGVKSVDVKAGGVVLKGCRKVGVEQVFR